MAAFHTKVILMSYTQFSITYRFCNFTNLYSMIFQQYEVNLNSNFKDKYFYVKVGDVIVNKTYGVHGLENNSTKDIYF
jgi:hypothetical protein